MSDLKKTFNRRAETYDRIRPGYPDALIEDVTALSGIPEDGRILEIGCGTGQATLQFASRGFYMDCIDIGCDLVAIVSDKLRGYSKVQVVVSSFEDLDSGGKLYDLIIAATSFHWIDPDVAYVKSSSLLKSSGALAVFSNTHAGKNDGFFAEVQKVYQIFAPSVTGSAKKATAIQPECFEEPVSLCYPWSVEYTTEQYLDLLSTYSDHISLPETDRNALFAGIAGLINDKYDGRVLKNYESVLNLRKKKD
ncbi:MAG: class I SAM-dependent methyltransferase [Candidatus Sabulitectum sp.]|nr:class I SAM-dependent methyltransferase [Candidatus Sabulitectum sp.]